MAIDKNNPDLALELDKRRARMQEVANGLFVPLFNNSKVILKPKVDIQAIGTQNAEPQNKSNILVQNSAHDSTINKYLQETVQDKGGQFSVEQIKKLLLDFQQLNFDLFDAGLTDSLPKVAEYRNSVEIIESAEILALLDGLFLNDVKDKQEQISNIETAFKDASITDDSIVVTEEGIIDDEEHSSVSESQIEDQEHNAKKAEILQKSINSVESDSESFVEYSSLTSESYTEETNKDQELLTDSTVTNLIPVESEQTVVSVPVPVPATATLSHIERKEAPAQIVSESNASSMPTTMEILDKIASISLEEFDVGAIGTSLGTLEQYVKNIESAIENLKPGQMNLPEGARVSTDVEEHIAQLQADVQLIGNIKTNLSAIKDGMQLKLDIEVFVPSLDIIVDEFKRCIGKDQLEVDHAKQLFLTMQINKKFANDKKSDGHVPLKGLFESSKDLSIHEINVTSGSNALMSKYSELTSNFKTAAQKTSDEIQKTKAAYQEKYDYVKNTQVNNNKIIEYTKGQKTLDLLITQAKQEIKTIESQTKQLAKYNEEKAQYEQQLNAKIQEGNEAALAQVPKILQKIQVSEENIKSLLSGLSKKSSKASTGEGSFTENSKLFDEIDGLTTDVINERLFEDRLQQIIISKLDLQDKELLKKITEGRNLDLTACRTLDSLSIALKDADAFLFNKTQDSILKIRKFPTDALSKFKGVPNFDTNVQLQQYGFDKESTEILKTNISNDFSVNSAGNVTIDKFGIELNSNAYSFLMSIVKAASSPSPSVSVGIPTAPPAPPAPSAPPAPPAFGQPAAAQPVNLAELKASNVTIIQLITAINQSIGAMKGGVKAQAPHVQKVKKNIADILETIYVEQIKAKYHSENGAFLSFVNEKIHQIKAEEQYKQLKQEKAVELDADIKQINIEELQNNLKTLSLGADTIETDLVQILQQHDLQLILDQKTSDLSQEKFDKMLQIAKVAIGTITNLTPGTDLRALEKNQLDSLCKQIDLIKSSELIEKIGLGNLFSDRDSIQNIMSAEQLVSDIKKYKLQEQIEQLKFIENQKEIISKEAIKQAKFVSKNAATLFETISTIDSGLSNTEKFEAIKKALLKFGGDIFNVSAYGEDNIGLKSKLSAILNIANRTSAESIPSTIITLGEEAFSKQLCIKYTEAKFREIIKIKNPTILDYNASEAKKTFISESFEKFQKKYKEVAVSSTIKILSRSREEDHVKGVILKAKITEFIKSITERGNEEFISELISQAGSEEKFFNQLVSKDGGLQKSLSKLQEGDFVDIFHDSLAKQWGIDQEMRQDLLKINKDRAKLKLALIQKLDQEKSELAPKIQEKRELILEEVELSEYQADERIKNIQDSVEQIKATIDNLIKHAKSCTDAGILKSLNDTISTIENTPDLKENPAAVKTLKESILVFGKYYINNELKTPDDPYYKLNVDLRSYNNQIDSLKKYLDTLKLTYNNLAKTPQDITLYSAIIKQLELSIADLNSYKTTEIKDAQAIKAAFKSIDGKISGGHAAFRSEILQLKKVSTAEEFTKLLVKKLAGEELDLKNNAKFITKSITENIKLSYIQSKATDSEQIYSFFTSQDFVNYAQEVSKATTALDKSQKQIIENEYYKHMLQDQSGLVSQFANKLNVSNISSFDYIENIHTNFAKFMLEKFSLEHASGMKQVFNSAPKIAMQAYDITHDIQYIDAFLDRTASILPRLTNAKSSDFNALMKQAEQSILEFVNNNFAEEAVSELQKYTSFAQQKENVGANASPPGAPPSPPGAPPSPPGAPHFVPGLAAASITESITANKEKLVKFNEFVEKVKNFVHSNIDNQPNTSTLYKQYNNLLKKIDAEYNGNQSLKDGLDNANMMVLDLLANNTMIFTVNGAPVYEGYLELITHNVKIEISKKLCSSFEIKLKQITKKTTILDNPSDKQEMQQKVKDLSNKAKDFKAFVNQENWNFEAVRGKFIELSESFTNVSTELETIAQSAPRDVANVSPTETFLEKLIKTKPDATQEEIKTTFASLKQKLGDAVQQKSFVKAVVNNFSNPLIQEQIASLINPQKDIEASQNILYRLANANDPQKALVVEIELNNYLKGIEVPSDNIDDGPDLRSFDSGLSDFIKLFTGEDVSPDVLDQMILEGDSLIGVLPEVGAIPTV